MDNVTVNVEQELYVIPHDGGGYTCLGFDVCLDWLGKYRHWLKAAPVTFERGTLETYNEYLKTSELVRKAVSLTGKRCDVHLTPELVGLEGKRVEVTYPDQTKARFWVGKSTGWIPCHLEIKTRASRDGGSVYFPKGATVRVIHSAGAR